MLLYCSRWFVHITEALKIIAKETAMSIKDAGAFVNDLLRGRGFGNVRAIGRLKVNKLAETNITNSGKTVLRNRYTEKINIQQ
jgi:hypothetical protein